MNLLDEVVEVTRTENRHEGVFQNGTHGNRVSVSSSIFQENIDTKVEWNF